MALQHARVELARLQEWSSGWMRSSSVEVRRELIQSRAAGSGPRQLAQSRLVRLCADSLSNLGRHSSEPALENLKNCLLPGLIDNLLYERRFNHESLASEDFAFCSIQMSSRS